MTGQDQRPAEHGFDEREVRILVQHPSGALDGFVVETSFDLHVRQGSPNVERQRRDGTRSGQRVQSVVHTFKLQKQRHRVVNIKRPLARVDLECL